MGAGVDRGVTEGFEEVGLAGPGGPQTTRFSCSLTHSRVRSDRWVGGGIDEVVSSQLSKVLPVGNPAALRRADR